jgi:hypothetical protein
MAKLSAHQSADFVKLVYIGESGTGKTGSLTSLVEAGYNLRVLDFDNGLDILRLFINHADPKLIDKVDYITLRDKFKSDPRVGAKVDGVPKAYTQSVKYLSEWDDETIPSEWGTDTIFVLDSLTALGRAAFRWALAMNPTVKDRRQIYGAAQEAIFILLELLTSDEFRTNVIIISHVDVREANGIAKGFPSSIGAALGPKIPTLFNTILLAESRGSGSNVKRTISTVPTSLIDLKNPAPFALNKSLPLETGLATVFSTLKSK